MPKRGAEPKPDPEPTPDPEPKGDAIADIGFLRGRCNSLFLRSLNLFLFRLCLVISRSSFSLLALVANLVRYKVEDHDVSLQRCGVGNDFPPDLVYLPWPLTCSGRLHNSSVSNSIRQRNSYSRHHGFSQGWVKKLG